ncbi:hypothetical protein BC939DRAFT_503493 [Gamsiella multidivaricata]|uniref:uncharacterized protein n=1 Tax=Gamsiella multidivaricata TaxID=101098 RepID=UPI0022212910|nr:uncharacterized protein BC939DRAFT_503493 [Gamsiella multidivaricata]KAG0363855.1 hypothetical protein BGZ54_007990 [Gamsiella multidivaricata]KAI7823028.1 hypothetical protein BC939DRAFT_503493 [Gamsiella multidivaricata]
MTERQRPTWLNQLPDHSIFELDEQEYLEWVRISNSKAKATDAMPRNTSAHSSKLLAQPYSGSRLGTGQKPSFGLDDLQEEYGQAYQGLSCMVVHGQDMYVAVGRQVRLTSLGELKKGVENNGRVAAAEFIDQKQHKVLSIDNIDFDVRRLVINQDGKLLAIVGDEKIVIAIVSKTVKQDPKAVNCKSFILGEYYHINKGPSKIVKVLWHPLSKGFTHVLVMTHDNLLRMYDVATDFEEPEQIFSFAEEGQTSGTYGLDVDFAASFCFGSKSFEWGRLTVYSITQNGDVYMMCPVMPGSCLLEAADLEAIRAKLEQKSAPGTESQHLEQVRRDWLECLLETVQPHPYSDEMVIVESPVLKHAKVARQGPFLFQPAPIELEDDDNRAYDILCLEVEAAEVLALAFSSGKVDLCIVVDRPSARWTIPRKLRSNGAYALDDDDDEEDDPLPIISAYESIDLGILKVFGTTTSTKSGGYSLVEKRMGIPNHPVLVADSMYGDTFYVYHETGAHYISIKPWLEELSRIYEAASQGVVAGLDARVAKFYDSKVKSSVGCIVTTRPTKTSPPAPIVGFSVVTDAYLEYSLLMLTASLQLIGQELMPRPRTSAIASSTQEQQTSTAVSSKEENTYQNTLTLPIFGQQDGLVVLNGLPLQPKVVLPPGKGSVKITVTEENLRFMGQMVQGIRESLREVYTACDVAQQRLVAQEAEYTRQQDKVAKTNQHIKTTLHKKMQEQVDRQDAQAARQSKLMARADAMMQKLMESREPELSPAERAWVVDVTRSEKIVKTFDERKHRVQTQYGILKRRMQEMQGALSGAVADDRQRHGNTLIGMSDFDRQLTLQQRQTARRYGTAQIKTVEGALSVESQLLDTTMKMLTEVSSRLEVLDVAKDSTD